MVLVKNLKLLQCFLLGTFILEKVFGDVLYRKFVWFHGFGQKFTFFLLGKIGL